MIVDSSVLIAIIHDEHDADRFTTALTTTRARISAATLLEATIVADSRLGATDRHRFDQMLAQFEIEVVPFTAEHAAIARQAHRDFGRGSGHPAGLNLGDCFAYALARATGEPLLYKGDDFGHTDVRSALA